MGRPVVHFEVIGRDSEKLHSFYSQLFGWRIDADNPMRYGIVAREESLSPEGIGIGGGIAGYDESIVPEPYVTFYVGVADVEAALQEAENLGGTRLMGPQSPMEGLTIGLFADPEGHRIGVVHGDSA